MSTTVVSNTPATKTVVSALLVLAMLALGCIFGYFALGQHQPPAQAVVPTDTPSACMLCAPTTGGNGGDTPDSSGTLGGTGGNGGNINGR